MKKATLFTRLMVPTLIALLLLPPLFSVIFQRSAERYAYSEAAENLTSLQESILPLMYATFDEAEQAMPSQARIRSFLRSLSPVIRKTEGTAKLLLLESQMKLIYPYDEQERVEMEPFVALCKEHLSSLSSDALDQPAEIQDEKGESFLVQYYRVPTESAQIRYLITYCSISQIHAWVDDATKLVALIAVCFALLITGVLYGAVRSVSRPLNRLRKGVKAIGQGSYLHLEPPFALSELEALRRDVNQASQRLKQADQAQRDFLQNVSHELRNPLMSIGGYAQGIERGVFPSPENAAHIILEESARLTGLVNRLLTLSRIENDPHALPLEKVRVAEPIRDCLDRVNGAAVQRGITLTLLPFDSSLCVHGEEELICNVLENLLTNAVRYAKAEVEVSARQTEGQVELSVRDDGDGIDEKDMPHLFERCYKGRGGSYGVGLAIAYSSAQKLKGTLRGENDARGGAVFTLRLAKEA
ncbi:MAG: HAMP domain-containing sensor histidine kinase [Eubacteriales bacterium]|nr:HAMP domain-containing sensor histidine kinase [Eubacteriales bacterium]